MPPYKKLHATRQAKLCGLLLADNRVTLQI
jgi:hypothetical protein